MRQISCIAIGGTKQAEQTSFREVINAARALSSVASAQLYMASSRFLLACNSSFASCCSAPGQFEEEPQLLDVGEAGLASQISGSK